jgi:hypothetical protein
VRRRLFNALAGASAVLCLAAMAPWISSYFQTIGFRWFTQNNQFSWTTDFETVRGGFQRRQDIRPPYDFEIHSGPSFKKSQNTWLRNTFAGFGKESFSYRWGSGTASRNLFTIPFYAIAIPAFLPPYFWFVKERNRRRVISRQKENRCIHCGYDLRATPDQCPECGTHAN